MTKKQTLLGKKELAHTFRQQSMKAEWEMLCHRGLLHSPHQDHIKHHNSAQLYNRQPWTEKSKSWRAREKAFHVLDSSSTNPQKDMYT
ncbi:rCG46695 [Rattus norvegicus]|uniref:RCG46695 n=1 Tax=Rattus norvegicus TaxID=10116 RepID=A6IX85_RAT|nr:rCG46695 [Rattus norvegicus]